MTLLYQYQMADELPMVYVTALPFGYVFGWNKPKWISRMWMYGTMLGTVLFTYIYIWWYRNPVFHQLFYAFLNFGLIFKSISLIKENVPVRATRRYLYKMLAFSFGLFAFGFFIWNCDNIFCGHLIFVRRNYLGLPFGVLTEGHGWWHIFTGLGIYYFIIYNELLSTHMLKRADKYQLVWHGPLAEVKLVGKLDDEVPATAEKEQQDDKKKQ
ncbi:unnamed protein product [Ambrosiozyma monospora]|uniref:Unnamed protein product n=1 Tax=Ambrosiozyma monospora TaxID=43982 RepID=A0A9W6YY91_AMBMO|nr:unnamed protein product [Ambrosiozyma monospora]